MSRVNPQVALEVGSHEALIRQAYKDSVGVWTWNVGLTNATGHRVERYIDAPASLQHCMNVYVWALRNYARAVDEVFAGHNLSLAQYAAALSFHWNTGAIKRAAWVNHWKAGNRAAARKAFMNWRSPPEIVPRRQKERDLFFDGKWTNDGTMLEFTRVRKPSYQPDWSSGRRINVTHELAQAFGNVQPPKLDQDPQPDNRPKAPTPSPEGNNEVHVEQPATPLQQGIVALILLAVLLLFGFVAYSAFADHVSSLTIY